MTENSMSRRNFIMAGAALAGMGGLSLTGCSANEQQAPAQTETGAESNQAEGSATAEQTTSADAPKNRLCEIMGIEKPVVSAQMA